MSERTGISWTDHTFNSWWGCHKVSDECANCYAEATAERFHPGHWGLKNPRWFFGDNHWNEPLRWNRKALKDGVRRRVFCSSMADVFELHPVDEIRAQQDAAREQLWRLIQKTPGLDWLLLTKRPENFHAMLPWLRDGQPVDSVEPWSNVWLGVTAGVRESFTRVSMLRNTPAKIRFISCEPILEHIPSEDWDKALGHNMFHSFLGGGPIHWLIVGDESGKKRRPAQVEWVQDARDAAKKYNVAFHFKQWAGAPTEEISGIRTNGQDGKIHLPLLNGKQHAESPGSV